MSKRTVLSRPRTRLYDASYNIGQSLYKPTLDKLDRKYSGRPLSPPRQLFLPSDTLERLDRSSLFDDDLGSRRRGETFFDSRGARIDPQGLDLFSKFDNETVTKVKSVRASQKVTHVDDADMEGAVSSLNSRRLLDRSDKILETMGITGGRRRSLDEDYTVKRRSVRVVEEDEAPRNDVTKWSAFKHSVEFEEDKASPASMRAKQTKARLEDLDDEMEAIAERQAAREKRAARLRQILAEVSENDLSESVADVIERKSVKYQEAEL